MQRLGKFNFKIDVKPNGFEKYTTFNNNKLIFIDSFEFLSSLDSLVKNLGKDDFKYFSQEFDNKVLNLVEWKGFLPYGYVSGFEKFKEVLSSKEKLYSLLTGKKNNEYYKYDKACEHVHKVWDRFEMKAMKDYHNLYLKCDVKLSADVFEQFTNSSLKSYGWSPSHYWSAPALSSNAMLNMTKIELKLFSDADMYIFFEKHMRAEFFTFRRDIATPTISI